MPHLTKLKMKKGANNKAGVTLSLGPSGELANGPTRAYFKG